MIFCKAPYSQHLITKNVNKEGAQQQQKKTRQGNKIKQQMIGASGKAKMEKIFEAFTFGAVSLHHKGRGTLSHSHYCLICSCTLSFRENVRVYLI